MSVIAFDGVCLGDGPATGVGRAFLDGLRAFAASGDEECVLLAPACAEVEDLPGVRRVTAPRGRLRRQRQLPGLLRALGAVAEDCRTGSATETVALTGARWLDQALAYVDQAREARVAAFNEELSEDLKAQGLPELIQSLSISPAGKEDDDKGVFVSASQLLDEARSDCASDGSNSPQTKRARGSA